LKQGGEGADRLLISDGYESELSWEFCVAELISSAMPGNKGKLRTRKKRSRNLGGTPRKETHNSRVQKIQHWYPLRNFKVLYFLD
jgi:hypothetical protein